MDNIMPFKTSEHAIRRQPYLCRDFIKEDYGMKDTAISQRLTEIRKEIKEGRYPGEAIIKDGNFIWVNEYVWVDYLFNRKDLREKNARKYVKEFSVDHWKKILGYTNQSAQRKA